MTASERTKKAGLKSLKVLAEASGYSQQTLKKYYKEKPERFEVILFGVLLNKVLNDLESAGFIKILKRFLFR
jgi:hypothetical protein